MKPTLKIKDVERLTLRVPCGVVAATPHVHRCQLDGCHSTLWHALVVGRARQAQQLRGCRASPYRYPGYRRGERSRVP